MEPCHTDLTMSSSNISTDTSKYHMIKHKWILWAHLPQDPDWTVKSYKKLYTFKHVEETVGIIESLPADFIKNCMLFIMKEGVAPMWEDPKNRNGGCFSYKVSNKSVVDVWRELTYGLIGDTISTNSTFVNSVTGITISPKKNFCIVKIWLTNCDHQNPQIVTSDIKHLIPQGCLFKKHTPEY